MQDLRLTVKKRAFPSLGRVRLNVAQLPGLGIHEGEHIDLVNEATKKAVTVSVIADTQVPEGQVRVSSEDLASLGLNDGENVLVRRSVPLKEKLTKAAADANASIAKSAGEFGSAVKAETKKASAGVEKAAASTAKKVKKTIRDATGKGDDL